EGGGSRPALRDRFLPYSTSLRLGLFGGILVEPAVLMFCSAKPECLTPKPGRKGYHSFRGAPARIGVLAWARDIGARNLLLDNHRLVLYNCLVSLGTDSSRA